MMQLQQWPQQQHQQPWQPWQQQQWQHQHQQFTQQQQSTQQQQQQAHFVTCAGQHSGAHPWAMQPAWQPTPIQSQEGYVVCYMPVSSMGNPPMVPMQGMQMQGVPQGPQGTGSVTAMSNGASRAFRKGWRKGKRKICLGLLGCGLGLQLEI